MKKVLTILFAFVLITAPALAIADRASDPATGCASCHCSKAQCCSANSSSPTGETPAAPAPSSTQNDFHAITWLVATWLTTPVATDSPANLVTATAPVAVAVPLFARDCAFLI